MQTDVTFGLTAYNSRGSILRAIDSALECDPTRIIVCDDGSTDGTREILQARADEEPRLQLEFNPTNLGVARARNRLIECCQTRFLVFLDDDDEATPNRVEKQLRTYNEATRDIGHDNVLVYGARHVIERDTVLHGLGVDRVLSGATLFLYAVVGLRRGGFHPGLMGTGTLFAPVETLRALGGFDPALRRNEDIELVMRAALLDYACVSAPEIVLNQHVTDGVEKSLSVEFDMRNIILRKHFRSFLRFWPLLPVAYFMQSLALRLQAISPLAKKGLLAVSLLFVNPIDAVVHVRRRLL